MVPGKVSGTILKRSVISYTHGASPIGTDCAFVPVRNAGLLVSTQAGVADGTVAAYAAVYKAANNIRAAGGTLLGIEAAFLLPPTAREIRLKELTKTVLAACDGCHTKLIGGHTEVTDAVTRRCVTVTAVGAAEDDFYSVHKITPGLDIVMSKWIGLEETALIVGDPDRKEALLTRFHADYLEETAQYGRWLSIEDEAAAAVRHGAAAMHDVSDGGIFTALWEAAEGSGCGFEVDLRAIPVRQPVIEIAEFFCLNPYRMKSSGSLLIYTSGGAALVKTLQNAGIAACVIGRTTDNHDKRLLNEGETSYLEKA